MSDFTPNSTEEFRRYVELQLSRHRLLIEDKSNSPELEEIEDELTELWEALDDVQRQCVRGMSSDLNFVSRLGQTAPKGRQSKDVDDDDLQEMMAMKSRKDWYGFLHYLRLCRPVFVAIQVARFRATAYTEMGLPGYAQKFSQLAVQLERSDALSELPA